MSKKGKIIGGVAIGLVAIYAVAPKVPDVETTEGKAMSASEFVELFYEDADEAENEYRNEVFEITGIYQYGSSSIEMRINEESDVKLHFDIEDYKNLPELERGDSITIKALFDKCYTDSYYFKDAIYVSHVSTDSVDEQSDSQSTQSTVMTADDFAILFSEDPDAAEENNKGKTFEISGEYGGDLFNSTVVIDTSLEYRYSLNYELRFDISDDEFAKIPELVEGDIITLKAEFDSITSYTFDFNDAIYISSQKSEVIDETLDESNSDNTEANTTTSAVTTITTTTSETTTAQTTTVTEAPIQTTTTTAATQAPVAVLEFVNVPDKVYRNQDATVTIKGKPNTEYNIFVYYSSGYSEADGLENKTSDANGNVTWTWHVGGSTGIGDNKRITVTGGDESITSYFEVLDSE